MWIALTPQSTLSDGIPATTSVNSSSSSSTGVGATVEESEIFVKVGVEIPPLVSIPLFWSVGAYSFVMGGVEEGVEEGGH